MLTRIFVVAAALALTLSAFVYLLLFDLPAPTAPDRIAEPIAQIAPTQRVEPQGKRNPDLSINAPTEPEPTFYAPTRPVEATQTPTPTPKSTVDAELRRIFGDDVTVERMTGGFYTVRFALPDVAVDAMLAEADRRIAAAVPLFADYVLLNFEGTFPVLYPDGRSAVETVLWVTIEDGVEVHRKEAPVLSR